MTGADNAEAADVTTWSLGCEWDVRVLDTPVNDESLDPKGVMGDPLLCGE